MSYLWVDFYQQEIESLANQRLKYIVLENLISPYFLYPDKNHPPTLMGFEYVLYEPSSGLNKCSPIRRKRFKSPLPQRTRTPSYSKEKIPHPVSSTSQDSCPLEVVINPSSQQTAFSPATSLIPIAETQTNAFPVTEINPRSRKFQSRKNRALSIPQESLITNNLDSARKSSTPQESPTTNDLDSRTESPTPQESPAINDLDSARKSPTPQESPITNNLDSGRELSTPQESTITNDLNSERKSSTSQESPTTNDLNSKEKYKQDSLREEGVGSEEKKGEEDISREKDIDCEEKQGEENISREEDVVSEEKIREEDISREEDSLREKDVGSEEKKGEEDISREEDMSREEDLDSGERQEEDSQGEKDRDEERHKISQKPYSQKKDTKSSKPGWVINPETGRKIRVGKPKYLELVSKGLL
jgi:hypothetical protein